MKISSKCKYCGKVFLSYKSQHHIYCSPNCFYKDRTGRKEVLGWSRKWKCCKECGTDKRPYHAYGLCKYCYNHSLEVQELKRKWARENKDKLRNKNRRYRKTTNGKVIQANNMSMRRRQIDKSQTDITTEWLRESYKNTNTCVLCGIQLQNNGRYPDGKHLDHIIPLSRGGLHTRSNVRYICARCNLTR